MTTLIYVFFCHWVADFLFQSRKIAERKSKDLNALVEHCIIYTCVMVILLVAIDLEMASKIAIVNGGAHLIIDGITSKITTYYYTNNKIHAFFSTIGFDQFLHTCVLILTVQLFAGVFK